MKIDELRKKLSEAGIPFSPEAKKPELQAIYDEAEADGAFADSSSEDSAASSEADSAPKTEEQDPKSDQHDPEQEQAPTEAQETHSEGEYLVLGNIRHDGVDYVMNDRIDLTAEQAEVLREVGMIQ